MTPDGRGNGPLAQLQRRFSRPGLSRESLVTYSFTGLALIANLATGVLVARLLGPSGRGEITAIANAAAWLSLFFLIGSREAIAYHQARHPQHGGRLMSTWLVIMIPASLLGIVVAELLLPLLFSAQTSETTRLGMLYLLAGIPLVLLSERLQGFLLGDHDFFFWNLTRIALPGLTMIAYLVLWTLDAFTVESALVTLIVASLLVCAASSVRILRRHGLAKPSRAIGKTTIWYGLRGSAGDALALLNSRLDLLILPAFVGATSVGYYSVATNVSWIIFTIASPLMSLVLPIAARQGEKGPAKVIKAIHLTLVAGAIFALVVGLLASVAVKAIYGADFAPSVEPLRILLPGTVLYGGAMVIVAGLYGAGRPFTAGVPQILGLVITGAGLGLFLRSGGINAAATVSTASYTLVFIVSAILYKRATELPWRAFLPSLRRTSPDAP